jgi:hypothetical protein
LVLLLTFPQLAHGAATVLPNLIGVWTGTTTAVGSTAKVTVTLTLTNVGPNPAVPNGYFEGTLSISDGTTVTGFEVTAGNDREFPYKVNMFPVDPNTKLSVSARLDWLPTPMLLVHGFSLANVPLKPFILKKTTA